MPKFEKFISDHTLVRTEDLGGFFVTNQWFYFHAFLKQK